MGAVLNPLNIRLHPSELGWIIQNAESKVVCVDETLMKKLQAVDKKFMKSVELLLVCGNAEGPVKSDLTWDDRVQDFDEFVKQGEDTFVWPDIREDAACALCYTSGTTGQPKGVMYNHRAVYLHAFGLAAGPSLGISTDDVILPVVPMFHVMCWGIPFVILMYGFDCIMTDRFLTPQFLLDMMLDNEVTISTGVPTLWQGAKLILESDEGKAKYAGLRGTLTRLTVGGSAVPPELIAFFYNEWNVEIIQGWGMTETGPVGCLSRHVLKASDKTEFTEEQRVAQQAKAGVSFPGLQWKIVDTEDFSKEMPQDGKAVGELLIKGPWVTQGYFRRPLDPKKFHDGYLVTGDISSISPTQVMKIEDRSKDLIKSGGEWISSIDMENMVLEFDVVHMCAVVGVPHPEWRERPVVIVILKGDDPKAPTLEEVHDKLKTKFAKFQLPDEVIVWKELPMTGTGKISKKTIREKLASEKYVLPKLRKKA